MGVVDEELQTRTYKHCVIITAAGSSNRFNSTRKDSSGEINSSCNTNVPMVKKEFIELDGMSILAHAVKPFLDVPGLQAVIITYKKGLKKYTIDSLKVLDTIKKVPFFFVEGGHTRQESVFNALDFVNNNFPNTELVSIHDGARPFVSKNLIETCLKEAFAHGGAAPCTPIYDTLVGVTDGVVSSYIGRDGIYGIQTPQTFLFQKIYTAHVLGRSLRGFTDDAGLFLEFYCHLGYSVVAVPSTNINRKITYANDLEIPK